jgi:Leucine-rich repeat (LRR) protein
MNVCGSALPASHFVSDDQGLLLGLQLEDNNLRGTIAPEIGLLSASVLDINLNKNGITGSIPTNVGEFTSMHQLSLATNQLNGSLPTELGNMLSVGESYCW